ncbi:MAG TPA: hypothetical protein VHW23_31555, partial [Kofleriaceae bacterium]|nr:hypothetical protein [Kofleriaceae bacterium]
MSTTKRGLKRRNGYSAAPPARHVVRIVAVNSWRNDMPDQIQDQKTSPPSSPPSPPPPVPETANQQSSAQPSAEPGKPQSAEPESQKAAGKTTAEP